MSDPFITLAQARQLATGSSLDVDPPNLSPKCETWPEFNDLVDAYYVFFCERIRRDSQFLDRLRPDRRVADLRRLLYTLRTAISHGDNPAEEKKAALWRSQHNSPQAAADALATVLTQGLEALCKIAVEVARTPDSRAKWQELLSVDVGTVFAAVSADLGLRFAERSRVARVRNVERRLGRDRTTGADLRVLVAEYCAQEILSDRRPLPVTYDKVLDALGLIGTTSAPGAILVAHSVAEISPGLDGAAFLTRVEKTWRAARFQ